LIILSYWIQSTASPYSIGESGKKQLTFLIICDMIASCVNGDTITSNAFATAALPDKERIR
jgi:hypothetical protein